MTKLPYSQLSKGTFLIASPEVDSGFYFRSILLLCEHNASGSFALAINKALEMQLPEEILNPNEAANPRVKILAGGHLQPTQMMLLHSSDQLGEQALKICDGVYLGGDLTFLQESIHDSNGPHVRLCFGYSGWGPGQLEHEFLIGNWFIHPATAQHVFETPPEKLWQLLLREMGGKYATLSMIPEDLSLN